MNSNCSLFLNIPYSFFHIHIAQAQATKYFTILSAARSMQQPQCATNWVPRKKTAKESKQQTALPLSLVKGHCSNCFAPRRAKPVSVAAAVAVTVKSAVKIA